MQAALTYDNEQLSHYFAGFGRALPVELCQVFTPEEMETLVCGSSYVDLDVLRSATDYHNCSEDDEHVEYFWTTLRELSPQQLSDFINFVYVVRGAVAHCGAVVHCVSRSRHMCDVMVWHATFDSCVSPPSIRL